MPGDKIVFVSESVSIASISLSNFRNHRKRGFEFSLKTTLIIGPNGSGKTNILEAVYLLATGESWRAEDAGEMVGFGGEVGHIVGKIEDGKDGSDGKDGYQTNNHPNTLNNLNHSLSVVLTRGNVGGKRVAKISFKVDETARRKFDFTGNFKVVLFEPESLQIVIGDPPQRRRFLDGILGQTDRDYANSLSVYSKALRVRNKLLDAIRDGRSRRDGLEYWERAMVKHGELLQNKRRELVEWINFKTDKLQIEYQFNSISADRLEKYREREIEAGFTFVGPQRDDLVIAKEEGKGKKEEGRPLDKFGSRGEQRMAVLRLKLLEAKWIEEKVDVSPVILLDDIFSELDEEHEKMVGKLIEGRQTVITATEIHKGHYPEAELIELE